MTKRFSQGRLLCLTNNAVIVSPPSSLVHQRSGHILRSDINYIKLPSDYNPIRLPSSFVLSVSVKDVRWMLSPHSIILNIRNTNICLLFPETPHPLRTEGIILWLIRSVADLTISCGCIICLSGVFVSICQLCDEKLNRIN